ncbi:MAG: hypothetical protein EOP49_51815, partial [Sphingobacteriales bacterium]
MIFKKKYPVLKTARLKLNTQLLQFWKSPRWRRIQGLNYLLYLAHGKTEILYEALYSILSYLRVSAQVPEEERPQIVIYTDSEPVFRKFLHGTGHSIVYLPVNQQLLTEWSGDIHYIHRAKTKVLQDFFSREIGNVLFVDADTVFLRDISHLFSRIGRGELVMHTCEGILEKQETRIFQKMYKNLAAVNFTLKIEGKRLEIAPGMQLWNSGVMGVNDRHKGLLPRMLDFTDAAHPVLGVHITEQVAVSFYFQQHRKIAAAENDIYHYWNFKEFRQVLTQFFTKNEGKT